MVYQQFGQYDRTLTSKEAKVSDEITRILTEIEEKILEEESVMNSRQLGKIKLELIKMREVLNPDKYVPQYGHTIVDSWDIESKLGDDLLKILHMYERIRTK